MKAKNIGALKGQRVAQAILGSDKGNRRLLIMLLFVVLAFSILQPHIFLTQDYLLSMLYLFPEYGILALGMLLCMISGGIDLSVVATANLSGILCALILVNTLPPDATGALPVLMLLVAIVASILLGMLCGLFNGFLIAKVGIPPILATLGGYDLILGLALALTKGSSVSGLPAILSSVGTHFIFGLLPVTLLVYVLCAMLIYWLLEKTTYGFKLYMLGSNAKASRYSGVNNDRIILKTYILSGALAAVAGILMTARFNSARAGVGVSYTMQAILICVLGDVSPNGGFGTVRGVAISVLILQVLSSGFNMFPFLSNFYRDLIWGAVLIISMAYSHISNRNRLLREQRAIGEGS